MRYLVEGRTVRLVGDRLVLTTDFGAEEALVPVENGLFRREREIDASIAFTEDEEGRAVLTGPGLYAERAERGPVTLLRAGLASAIAVAALAPLVALGRWLWLRRRGDCPATFRGLGIVWWAAAGIAGLLVWAVAGAAVTELATSSPRALVIFGTTLAYPLLAVAAGLGAAWGWRRAPRRAYAILAALAALAHAGLAVYLAWWGLIGFRTWTY